MTLVLVLVVIAIIVFLFSKNISAFFYRRMSRDAPSPFNSTNFQIAQRFELKRDYDRALTAYTHLIEEFPDFDAAYISMADIYRKKRDYEGAVSILKRLYERNKSPDTLFLICEVYMAKGDTYEIERYLGEHREELREYIPIIESYLRAKRENDSEALTHLRILAGSEDVKDYIRLKAKRVIGYL